MHTSDLKEQIEQAAQASLARIRNHPFIQHANDGSLTREQAVRWIMCAGRESRSFPSILEKMLENTKNAQLLNVLTANLKDEYGNGNSLDAHFCHYLQLLDALKIERASFESYEEGVGIKLALELAYNVASSSEELALGYILVNELMTQITYASIHKPITKYYGDVDIPFFKIHVSIDEHHVLEIYNAIEHSSNYEIKDIMFGISLGERGMAALLDEAYGVFLLN